MKKIALGIVAALLMLWPTATWASTHATKVTLCHRTNSNTNPYVQITVDENAVVKQGHDGHDGPVWNSGLKAQHVKWGDIIPPFGEYPGKNYPAGKSILDDGCKIPTSSPSPTPTVTRPTPTPTVTHSTPTPKVTHTKVGSTPTPSLVPATRQAQTLPRTGAVGWWLLGLGVAALISGGVILYGTRLTRSE